MSIVDVCPNPDAVLVRTRSYVRRNVVDGLRTGLRGAPVSTWALVPLYVSVAIVLGFGSGLFSWELPSGWELLLPLALIVHPALSEEVIFRGLLLPRSLTEASMARRWTAIAVSTGLFVLWHPLNAWFIGMSDTSVFTSPVFLTIVAVLGVTNAVAYLRSGSLWAPILIHWATVAAWNLFLGRDFAF